jgi:hypothetical protein
MSKEAGPMFVLRRPGHDSGADGLLTRRLRKLERGAAGTDPQLSSIMDMIAKSNQPKLSLRKLGSLKKSDSWKAREPSEADSPSFKTPKVSSTRPPSRQRAVERERLQVVTKVPLLPTLKDEDWLDQALSQHTENDLRRTKWVEENGSKFQTPMTARGHLRTVSDRADSKADLTTTSQRSLR